MHICAPVEQFSDPTENTLQQDEFRNFGFHERRVAPCGARVNGQSGWVDTFVPGHGGYVVS